MLLRLVANSLLWLACLALLPSVRCHAQWQIESSPTSAGLRGIVSLGRGIAWASGNHGTVLRTLDGGKQWESCTVPPGAGQLDFRAVQALDERTAFAMSAGKGTLSRLYKTVDGCRTWQLLFTNPEEEGFWDVMLYLPETRTILLLGDPVDGRFALYSGANDGSRWLKNDSQSLGALPAETLFAASNSSLAWDSKARQLYFVTGGNQPEILQATLTARSETDIFSRWSHRRLPLASGQSGGAFSLAIAPAKASDSRRPGLVVVGGDYKHPGQRQGTAAFSLDGGHTFSSAQTLPSGYRSAVAYSVQDRTWIAAGPNGTDISRDDGRNWSLLAPGAAGKSNDSGREWNAMSLPFAVGPHGRIGKLSAGALRPRSK